MLLNDKELGYLGFVIVRAVESDFLSPEFGDFVEEPESYVFFFTKHRRSELI